MKTEDIIDFVEEHDEASTETGEQVVLNSESLELALKETNLKKETSVYIRNNFQPFFAKALEWQEKAYGLVVTSPEQTDLMHEAKQARLLLKQVRTDADKVRKALKEDALRYGNAVQAVFNMIKNVIVPIEKHLLEQENFIKIQDSIRKYELEAARIKLLAPLGNFVQPNLNLRDMTEKTFQEILADATKRFNENEEQLALLRKAEQERQEKRTLHEERKNEILNYWYLLDELQKSADFSDMTNEDWVAFVSEKKQAHISKQAEIAEEKKLSSLQHSRTQLILPYIAYMEKGTDLRNITDAEFDRVYRDAESKFNEAEQIKKAEQAKRDLHEVRKNALLPYWHLIPQDKKTVDFSTLSNEQWNQTKAWCEKRLREENERIAKENAERLKIQAQEAERLRIQREQAELEEKRKNAPDLEKIFMLMKELADLNMPDMSTETGKEIINFAKQGIDTLVVNIKKQTDQKFKK